MKFKVIKNRCPSISDLEDILENFVDKDDLKSRLDVLIHEMSARRDLNMSMGEEFVFKKGFESGFAAAHIMGDMRYEDD